MQCVIDRTVRGAPAERRSGSFTALLLILGALLANKTQSSHRITAGGKRRAWCCKQRRARTYFAQIHSRGEHLYLRSRYWISEEVSRSTFGFVIILPEKFSRFELLA